METKIAHLKKLKSNINFIAEEIKNGKLIIMPTDTIYGFIADAFNHNSVNKIFDIKKRDKNKKFLILIKNLEAAKQYADNENYSKVYKQIKSFSNKPTTFILKAAKGLPEYIVKNGKIAFRVPKKQYLIDILNRIDSPLVAPSANLSGEKNIKFYTDIINLFTGKVDYIFYKYFLWRLKPSRIIDISEDSIKIVRM